MEILGLQKAVEWSVTTSGVVCYGPVLRRDDDNVLRVALYVEVSGKGKRRQPKKTW